MTAHWTVVVPIISLAENTSRLGNEAESLTRSIALDTVSAIATCDAVERIVVCSDTPQLTAELTAISTKVTVTAVTSGATFDGATLLSPEHTALSGAVALVRPVLPALAPEQLSALLRAAQEVPVGIVTDINGRGATVLTAHSVQELAPTARPGIFDAPAAAQPLEAGATVRRAVTSARDLAHVREWPTLGTRTKMAANLRYLTPSKSGFERHYGIEPPPAND